MAIIRHYFIAMSHTYTFMFIVYIDFILTEVRGEDDLISQ